MTCGDCGQSFLSVQCPCGWKPASLTLLQQPWVISYCTYPVGPACTTAIRHRPGQLDEPICTWHRRGVAGAPSAAPPSCPDPVLPWPWKTEKEREEQARKLYWQERFKQYPALYARWIVQPDAAVEME